MAKPGDVGSRSQHSSVVTGPRNILVGVSDSIIAPLVLESAVDLARNSAARLTLLHVLEANTLACLGAAPVELPGETDEAGNRLLASALERVPEDLPATSILRTGAAAEEILRRARAADHDAIVIGSCWRTRLGDLLLGLGTTRYIQRNSPVPVIVVRAPHG